MTVNVNGRQVKIDKKISASYEKISHPLNDNAVEMILQTDGIDASKLSDKELEKAVNKSLLNELKELEQLSRPETTKAAITFAQRK